MTFNDLDEIKNASFIGFKTMKELFNDSSILPSCKGIYLVLYLDKLPPQFLITGSGGHFKGKNPNVSVNYLKDNWINNTIIVYIGKAGNDGGSATLKSRLRQYFSFGQGKNIGHWGGRLIWQLKNHKDLIVCWKALPEHDPRTVEAGLIQQFITKFGKRPFANLAD
jgi:hypothetical protein